MTMHLRENRTIRATVARKDGNMLGVRFELADSKERSACCNGFTRSS